jgi:DICT domain-containing protein
LRQNVLCEADDTLLAQKPRSQGGLDKRPGDGQARMCKDWNQLSTFAKQFNACYKRLNITRGGIDVGVSSEIERYRFCPEGSPYLPAMKQFFGEADV